MSETNTLAARNSGTPTIRQHLEGDAFKRTVAAALPKHLTPDRFIRVALTSMTRIPKLANCDQSSFFQCLLTLSALGLEPDGRRAHLIPFENRKRGVTECQLIIDWKGLVELALRSGTVANLHADVVREGDVFDYSAGKIKTHIPWFLRRDNEKPTKAGEVFAAYAIAEFKDGTTKAEVLALDEINGIRDASQGYRAAKKFNNDSHPWIAHWLEMAKKTAFRRLSKWLPLSPEYRDALDAEETQDAATIPIVATVSGSPFVLPEQAEDSTQETDNSNADLAPVPAQKPPEQKPAEENLPPSIKEQLATLVTGAGHTFDEFIKWAVESGNLEAAARDAVTSFEEVPVAKAKYFVQNQKGMLKQLGMMKGAL